jgi:signal transduction histidine kinase
MKTMFLDAVSHELRTPLAAVLGIALTLERQEVQLSSEEVSDLLNRLAGNARKLDRLLADLLDLERLARGVIEPNVRRTDLGDLVRRVARAMDFGHRTVVVDETPAWVQVDPPKVERIVENLLANTIRHTPEGATVWVRVDRDREGVLLVVEDDGPGVPEDLRRRVFDPFTQGPQRSAHAPGVGIGLSLVDRFARLHGGRAWVEERPGGGASFRVLLPDPRPGSRRGGRPHPSVEGPSIHSPSDHSGSSSRSAR